MPISPSIQVQSNSAINQTLLLVRISRADSLNRSQTFTVEIRGTRTSVSAVSTGFTVRELQQLRIDHLVCLLQHLYQVVSLAGVIRSEESVSGAGLLPAASTADAMDIIFGTGGVVKIDDKLDVFNV